MALKAIYEKQEDIPTEYADLYSERNGKWELTGIEGIKTDADVARVQDALTKERSDHKETKTKLAVWGDLKHDEVLTATEQLVEANATIDTLKASAKNDKGQPDEEAIQKLVDAKIATIVAPVQRELDAQKKSNGELTEENTGFKSQNTLRTITDSVRKAATAEKVVTSAMGDIELLAERVFEVIDDGSVVTRDGVGVTPGIPAETWLGEMKEKRAHWWPANVGGGAGGGGGPGGFSENPFTAEHWNMTKQGEAVTADRDKADRMAKAAGTSIGGVKPPAKKAAA